jgi:hypothetical protein
LNCSIIIEKPKTEYPFGCKFDGNADRSPAVFWGLNNVDNSMNADGSVTGKHNSVAQKK